MTRRVQGVRQYKISYDRGNFDYSQWMCVMATLSSRFDGLTDFLGNKGETWADQVEAAFGLCIVAERVPALRSFCPTDLQLTRETLENSILEFRKMSVKLPRQLRPTPRRPRARPELSKV